MQLQDVQIAYLTTPLAAGDIRYQPHGVTPFWMQIADHPLNVALSAVPVVHQRRFVKGLVDTDVAGTLAFVFSDTGPPGAGNPLVTVTFAIPGNLAGNGSTFKVETYGKFCQVRYTNGGVAQTRFTLLANLCDL